MFDFLLPNKKDLEALFRALAGNPLLAALLLINPLEAFRFMNIVVPRFLGALLPPAGEDAQLAQALLQALREGRTTLERPQVIVTPPPAAPEPPAAPHDAGAAPAMTLSIAKATLQHALGLYERGNFHGREFVFQAQSWLDVATTGESLALDLGADRAEIVARLQGSMAFKVAGMQLDLKSQRVTFPIELRVLAALAVDAENRLFLRISSGAVSIGSTPLPARIANDLVARITATLHSIPLVQAPTSVEIPGDPPAALALRLANVGIASDGLILAFQLS